MTIKARYNNLPVGVRAAMWFFVCSFCQKAISVITTPVFTRLFSTSEYGQYSAFQSWFGIISVFVSLRLSYGVYTQGLVKFEAKRNMFVSSLQGLTLTLCALGLIVYCICPNFWNSITKLTEQQTELMLILIWTSTVFEFWAAEKRVTYDYKPLAVATLIIAIASPSLSIFLVIYSQDKVTARIIGRVLVGFIGCAWMFIAHMIKGRTFFNRYYWRYALAFNIPLIPHYLSQTVLINVDRIMIRDIVGADDAGVYSIAYSVAMLMALFNTALMQTIEPWIYRKIKDNSIEEIRGVAYPALIFISLVNLLLMAFAPEMIKLFAPPAYHDAIWVIPPISMSVVFIFSYDIFSKFEFYYEKTSFIMVASIASALANVILNYIFIHLYGYRAAAYTTLLCYAMYAFGHFLFMNKICDDYMNGKRPFDSRVLIFIYTLFLLLGFLVLASYNSLAFRLTIMLLSFIIFVIFRKPIVYYCAKFLELRHMKKDIA